MNKKFKSMDGNSAAAYIAYALSESCAIYPITPSSAMAESVDSLSANNKKNIFDVLKYFPDNFMSKIPAGR